MNVQQIILSVHVNKSVLILLDHSTAVAMTDTFSQDIIALVCICYALLTMGSVTQDLYAMISS